MSHEVVTRSHGHARTPRGPRFLVPVDFSASSGPALARAVRLATEVGAAVDLLHVWPAEAGSTRALEPNARLALARAALALEDLRRGVRASRIRIAYGRAAEAIVRVAAEGYDLIVMSGHGAAEHAVHDGVLDEVTCGASCPVLAVDRERAAGA